MREMLVGFAKRRESLRGPKAQEKQGPRPDLTHPVAKRGTASMVGSNRRSVGPKPRRFREKTQGRKGGIESFCRPLWRRKALKGEAQERGELKEASMGLGH
jgi:hypothetical protein